MERGRIDSVREKVTGRQESQLPEEAEQVGDGGCRGAKLRCGNYVDHCHTFISPLPSPVKNIPPGPVCIFRTSCIAKILPLSLNLSKNTRNKYKCCIGKMIHLFWIVFSWERKLTREDHRAGRCSHSTNKATPAFPGNHAFRPTELHPDNKDAKKGGNLNNLILLFYFSCMH